MNIASPEHKANPFPFYARLRSESPVHRVVLPHNQSAWLVTRYDDVVLVLKDRRFAKSNSAAKQPWVPSFVKTYHRELKYESLVEIGNQPRYGFQRRRRTWPGR
jgi:cytochrome P450 PksS